MKERIHTFSFSPGFGLMNKISAIDRFDAEWEALEKREGRKVLKELRSVATVESTGASTRIEGSNMTDEEVEHFIGNIDFETFEKRDEQEVSGYFNTLEMLLESYEDIDISIFSIKNLHNQLLKFSEKDKWHKGGYKQMSNTVEAKMPSGDRSVVFNTTEPGIETEDAMRQLIDWYQGDNETPPILKSAAFVYDFLSIHPFQDGNGRLSRLLTTLLLMKHGYTWIQYVSFEHEIENRKREYYRVLKECQSNRPGENIDAWLDFFLNCLFNLQNKLKSKVERQRRANELSTREKAIYNFIANHPGAQAGDIGKKLGYALPTVKRDLSGMVKARVLGRHGEGKGTNYTIEPIATFKQNIMMPFTDEKKSHEFQLKDRHQFMEIKKILVEPKFDWKKPDEWSQEMSRESLGFKVEILDSKGVKTSQPFRLSNYNSPMHFQPVFTIPRGILIPKSPEKKGTFEAFTFPLTVTITRESKKEESEFDFWLVYDGDLEE